MFIIIILLLSIGDGNGGGLDRLIFQAVSLKMDYPKGMCGYHRYSRW